MTNLNEKKYKVSKLGSFTRILIGIGIILVLILSLVLYMVHSHRKHANAKYASLHLKTNIKSIPGADTSSDHYNDIQKAQNIFSVC